jgi:hypothetical protein
MSKPSLKGIFALSVGLNPAQIAKVLQKYPNRIALKLDKAFELPLQTSFTASSMIALAGFQ